MKLLISNDDGIHSEGIAALYDELKKIADVIVVAPDRERSAAAHSLTLHHPLRVQQISKSHYAIDGTPTDAVILGVCAILKKKPDIIVSGINKGPNLGDDITYSGTVAAAIEGTILGVPSFAISLASNGDSSNFQPAASFAAKLVKSVMKYSLPKNTLLNVNVPDLSNDKIKGSMITRQGKRLYDNTIVEKTDPRGKKYYWMGGDEIGFLNEPGTDFDAIEKKYISITPIKLDLTDHDIIKGLKKWEI